MRRSLLDNADQRGLECGSLNGSSWETERQFLEQRRQDCGVFVGIEHRQKGHQQWNKLAKKRYIIAETDARSSKGPISEFCTSGGVMVVVREKRVATVVDQKVGLCETKHPWKRS